MTVEFGVANSPAKVVACFPVLFQLRTHITDLDSFTEQVSRQIREGYRLACLREPSSGNVVAVAGYRVFETFFDGKVCHVDDLVTDSAQRGKGFGAQILAAMKQHAKHDLGCVRLRLDSGLQRLDAHRFYEANGMQKAGYHFNCQLDT